ncbi:MAG: Dabb family protein [Robiginitalea sp.]|jgi:hypothetical protein
MRIFLHLLVLISLAATPVSATAQESDGTNSFDPSFTHVVYFWLNNPDDPDQRQQFETSLRKLFRNSLYTKTNFLGSPPKATREVVDDTFTYAMMVTFESASAQDAYQKEQAHLDFIAEAGHLLKKYVVYDAVGLKE